MRRVGGQVARQAPMLLTAAVILVPLYFMVVNSLKTNDAFLDSSMGLPSHPSLRAYGEAGSGRNLGRLFWNSAVISVASVALTTSFGAFAAFALAKMVFRGRDLFFRLMLPLMVIPPIVLLVPQFKLMSAAGLVNNQASVIIIYVGLMLPFTIYLLRNFFVSFPDELLDAAALDGCSPMTAFLRVVVPVSRPALITAIIVNFVFAWNELLIALVFLQSEGSRTLVVGLTVFRSRFSLDVPVLMAGLTIATVPVLLVYLFGQRYLVRGLLAGSSK